MGFKVGDRVKIIGFPTKEYVGKIYKLISISSSTSCFAGRLRLPGYGDTLVYKKEIEKAPTKGQQLLFSFMGGV